MSSIKELLSNTALEKVDAKVLLADLIEKHLQWPKSALISKDTDALPEHLLAEWQRLESRRLAGEPVAYILGKKEFFDIELKVAPGVLIPRPETELLVELVIEYLLKKPNTSARILDLGTGSGAIALALAKNIPQAQVTAVDISPEALSIAQHNAHLLQLEQQLHFYQGSWFDALPKTTETPLFDIIVSNPPYIEAQDPHLISGDLRFEPPNALTDHFDGLTAYRNIFNSAKSFLTPNGMIVVEHGFDQSEKVTGLLQDLSYSNIQIHYDLAGIARAVSAKLS